MAGLKAWMRKEDIYDNDLFEILQSFKIKKAPDDFKRISQGQWDQIWRRGRVERFKELKDQDSRNRLDKKMKKLEKIWRQQSGIKLTSIKTNERAPHKNTKTKKKQMSAPKTKKKGNVKSSYSASSSQKNTKTKKKKKENGGQSAQKKKGGHELKVWMQGNGCFENTLYKELLRKGVNSPASIKNLSEQQFDTIVRKVRVDRFAQLKDQAARNRCDKLLVQFEKQWRRLSGNKKTNLKKYA
mmetsp:Transcript_24550/g.38880  ORF Transcript_24550/g.38880 Transcript_24550/m.38880 type:complete len:241 (+) Transcript_24550:17-739(+)